MIRQLPLAALLLLAACGGRREPPPASTDPSEPSIATVTTLRTPPIYALLGFRDRLQLTSAQITAIDSIGQQVSRANGPLVSELREAMNERAARRSRRDLDDEERANFRTVRDNNQRAIQGIQGVLTDEQERIVCELWQDDPREAAARRARVRGRDGRMIAPLLSRPPWPWCAPPAAAREETN